MHEVEEPAESTRLWGGPGKSPDCPLERDGSLRDRRFVRADGRYEPLAIDGDLAVAHGRSRYFRDASKTELAREYDNLFLIRFDGHGRCRSIREWYMSPRGQREPARASG